MKRRSRRTDSIALSAAIFAVAFIVRLMPLGLYVTPDEPIWVLRSHEFLQAVETSDLAAVLDRPSWMTTMALGALGICWSSGLIQPRLRTARLTDRIATLAPENGARLSHTWLLFACRPDPRCVRDVGGVAFVHVVIRTPDRRSGCQVKGFRSALDPFLAGHSGLLHTGWASGNLCTPGCGSATSPVRWQATDTAVREWLPSTVATAAFPALAGLTKMPLLAAPGLAPASSVERPAAGRPRRRASTVDNGIPGAALSPHVVSPREALASLIGAVTYHEGIGLRPVFFAGETSTDPGVWFYPVVLLFRLTPPVLVGLLFLIYVAVTVTSAVAVP